jgi:glycosyltransferase involved in cell wall biosynthesis
MACRRAIVATRTGGIPEVVEDGATGLLVPPRDHVALAQAIVRMLGDAEMRTRMGDAGRVRVVERFTVERMVAETAAAYARVVGKRRAADTVRSSGAAD